LTKPGRDLSLAPGDCGYPFDMLDSKLAIIAGGLIGASLSSMPDANSPQIGPFLQAFRRRQHLTLDGLAKLSGLSKSMLSQIERGQTNPTLATVWALAEALKVDISELIGGLPSDRRLRIDVASPSFTPEIRTEDGLCILRILSPADKVGALEWYELNFAPRGALISSAHAKGSYEHLTVLTGELVIEAGDERRALGEGATGRYPADVRHAIRNEGANPARALLVVIT
jgi:XRE family transcriptional regulator, regulator of sulfur utilization